MDCTQCGTHKELNEFYHDTKVIKSTGEKKTFYRKKCKVCYRDKFNTYYANNTEKRKKQRKEYYQRQKKLVEENKENIPPE